MTREEIMQQLNITEDDVIETKFSVFEKLFCASISTQGTDKVTEILGEYNKLRDVLYKRKA